MITICGTKAILERGSSLEVIPLNTINSIRHREAVVGTYIIQSEHSYDINREDKDVLVAAIKNYYTELGKREEL